VEAAIQIPEEQMTDVNRLAEQHIRESESRLRHIDELVARARDRVGELPEYAHVHTELDELVKKRDTYAVRLHDMKQKAAGEWQQHEVEQSGPMGVWDALAKQLERLLERVEK
jgi:hypothetical protein